MNHLNSVLIEGVLVHDPVMVEKDTGEVLIFKLESTRYNLRDGERHQELSFFDIEVRATGDIAKCKALTAGRGVRVVGRMMTEQFHDRGGIEHHKLIIIAESIEIKTKFDRKPGEVQS